MSPPIRSQVVCVLGMHRSGTSIVAGAIERLGISFGPVDGMLEPDEGNPMGFWERHDITSIDDEILERLGGKWHVPPHMPRGWERSTEWRDLMAKARDCIDRNFAGTPAWGWKDPRACLTLPFWQELVPMRYVVCLRSPLAVAHSLELRDGIPIRQGETLWHTYVRSALRHTRGRPRHLLFYEDFMRNTRWELRLLGRFMGEESRAEDMSLQEDVNALADRGLEHHRAGVQESLTASQLSRASKALYLRLRASVRVRRAVSALTLRHGSPRRATVSGAGHSGHGHRRSGP